MRVLAGFTLRDFWEVKPPAQSNDGPAAEFVIAVPFKFVVGTYTLPPRHLQIRSIARSDV